MTAGLLRPGQVVLSENARVPCLIVCELGGGGQGEVYGAELRAEAVAVKWYHPGFATAEQRGALADLIRRGRPSPAFLWPMDIVSAPATPGFGYAMPIRDERFAGMAALVRREVEPSARVLATIGLGLAEAFLRLHAEGLCYRDISLGNAFFDPVEGEVLICDNDNVAIDGSTTGGVLGTPRFMAPEVVRGEALPSSRTDLFSLAVLLFTMFFVHHPLEGRREQDKRVLDFASMRALYGTDAVFIFDPDDDSNRPVEGAQQNALDLWPLYPRALRDLFVQVFTAGIRDPREGRVRESQWRQAMVRLRDSVVVCDACGGDAESFYDPEEPWGHRSCWRCGNLLPPALYLAEVTPGRQSRVVVSPGAAVFPHHLDGSRLYDFSTRIGEVVRHPSDPAAVGLRNGSGQRWRAGRPGGSTREVDPGKSVRLSAGTVIEIGPARLEVRAAP